MANNMVGIVPQVGSQPVPQQNLLTQNPGVAPQQAGVEQQVLAGGGPSNKQQTANFINALNQVGAGGGNSQMESAPLINPSAAYANNGNAGTITQAPNYYGAAQNTGGGGGVNNGASNAAIAAANPNNVVANPVAPVSSWIPTAESGAGAAVGAQPTAPVTSQIIAAGPGVGTGGQGGTVGAPTNPITAFSQQTPVTAPTQIPTAVTNPTTNIANTATALSNQTLVPQPVAQPNAQGNTPPVTNALGFAAGAGGGTMPGTPGSLQTNVPGSIGYGKGGVAATPAPIAANIGTATTPLTTNSLTGGAIAQNASNQQLLTASTGGGLKRLVSDENLKTNITPANSKLQDFMSKIGAHQYNYKEPEKDGQGTFTSPMAQELESTDLGKQAVIDTPRGKMVDYARLGAVNLASTAVLYKEQQRMQATIDMLRKKVKI